MAKKFVEDEDRVNRVHEIVNENPLTEGCFHYFEGEPFLNGQNVDEETGDAEPSYMMVDRCIHCGGYNL